MSEAAAIANPSSGGFCSSSRHPTGEGNFHRRHLHHHACLRSDASLLGNRPLVAHLFCILWRTDFASRCATELSPLKFISVASVAYREAAPQNCLGPYQHINCVAHPRSVRHRNRCATKNENHAPQKFKTEIQKNVFCCTKTGI